jgi:hypothetical protein
VALQLTVNLPTMVSFGGATQAARQEHGLGQRSGLTPDRVGRTRVDWMTRGLADVRGVEGL